MGFFVLAVLASACSSGGGATPNPGNDAGTTGDAGAATDAPVEAGYQSPVYSNANMWLCGAGAAHDYCLEAQAATDIRPDLSLSPVAITPATSPKLDCFYVYPTVDITSPPGNVVDFSSLPLILDVLRQQAAPFVEGCTVYAPLYHQATYKSYFDASAKTYLEVAYTDVVDAFRHYMGQYNKGRDFVLIGHSQGTHMLRRLIQREIEAGAGLQKQLALAILLGAFGDIAVPKGQLVGSTFKSTPLCNQDTQRGCVITLNTFAKGYEPGSLYASQFNLAATDDVGCVNPAALGGGIARLGRTYFLNQYNAAQHLPTNSSVTTTFAAYPDFYTGQCMTAANGYSFFEIDPAPKPGDTRTNPIPFAAAPLSPASLGLHILDFDFPLQDLLDAVKKR